MLPSFFRIFLKRLLVLLLAYEASRIVFLIWNWPLFTGMNISQWAPAFFYGLRFDLAAILFTNAILFPLWLLPAKVWSRVWFVPTEFSIFILLNFVALGLNFIDVEFTNFIGKRISYDLLFIRGDVERQSFSILLSYWRLASMLLIVTAAIWWFAPRFKAVVERRDWLSFAVWRFLFLLFVVLGMRGGFQFKPLHPMHAYYSTHHELGLLTLNTPFNLAKSRPRGAIYREQYFAETAEAVKRADELTKLSRPPLGVAKNWNVVVLILESFNLEYMGASNEYRGYTPFLDELSKEAFFFPLNFANARRSIEGVPATLCGLPAMMAEPLITSDFANNRVDCLPKILGRHGYSTYFLHGAHNGSMHFDTFSKIAGFETFVGLNEYPKDNRADLDEQWGVLDEPMLQYAAKTIDNAKKPVMLSVFTLSSHHPYFIPPQHRGKFPKGTLEIHESIGYTDLALREFFATARTKPWFKKTIFVLTADHTQKSDQPKYADLIGAWRTPLFIYVPGLKSGEAKTSPTRITQQADIVPSVLDLLGITEEPRLIGGVSVFDEKRVGRAFNYTSTSYWYIDPKVMIELGRPPFPTRAFRHKQTYNLTEASLTDADVQTAILDLKSFVQYVNEGMIKNTLHNWKSSP